MINKITEWSYDKPTEEGDYLVCYGDVETPANVQMVRFINSKGELITIDDLSDGSPVSNWSNSWKFARLVYAPSELKKIEGDQDD